jgi:AraC-like DNA-binding protein
MDPRFETIHPDVDSAFRAVSFECETFSRDHPWHYHPEYELTWIVRSCGTRFVGDHAEPYGPGDLVLVGPNLPHCWHSDPPAAGAERPALIVIQFGLEAFGANFFTLPECRSIAVLLERARRAISFDAKTARRVGPILLGLVAQTGAGRLARLLDALDLLSAAPEIRPLASENYHVDKDINPVSREKIDAVHRYIRQNLTEEIRQAEIAERLGMSTSAFSRFFKIATGETFVGCVNILRVNEACRLLNRTQRTVIDIAMECGYHNISNFNRQFRALRGMNPSEYRQHLRGLSDHEAHWCDQGASSPGSRFAAHAAASAAL